MSANAASDAAQWNFTSNQALRLYSRWDKRDDRRGETGLTWLHHF
jgi:hypothetical protein